jgi:hypothetical protein
MFPLIYNAVHEPVIAQTGKLVDTAYSAAGSDAEDKTHRLSVPPLRGLPPAAENADNPVDPLAPDKSG